jgi:hypothetical protein
MVIAVGGNFLCLVIKSVSVNVRHILSVCVCGVVSISHFPQMCSCETRAFNMPSPTTAWQLN